MRAAFAEAVVDGSARGAALETTVALAARLFDVPSVAVMVIGADRLRAETAVGSDVRECLAARRSVLRQSTPRA